MNEILFLKVNEETELKYLSLNDASILFNLIEKNRSYLRQWLPWLDHNKTIEDSVNFIKKCIHGYQVKNELSLAIAYKNNFSGMLSFHEIDSSLKLAKIGYWLDQDLQKNGIIYNSCKQFIQYGFENLKLEKIEISCATENMPSNAIAKKLKFKFNKMNPKSEWNYDHYKDINLYLMTKEDWHKLTS